MKEIVLAPLFFSFFSS